MTVGRDEAGKDPPTPGIVNRGRAGNPTRGRLAGTEGGDRSVRPDHKMSAKWLLLTRGEGKKDGVAHHQFVIGGLHREAKQRQGAGEPRSETKKTEWTMHEGAREARAAPAGVRHQKFPETTAFARVPVRRAHGTGSIGAMPLPVFCCSRGCVLALLLFASRVFAGWESLLVTNAHLIPVDPAQPASYLGYLLVDRGGRIAAIGAGEDRRR